MNKTNNLLSVYLILGMLALSGCGPDITPAPKFTYTTVNETGLALKLTCAVCQTVNVAIGEKLTFGSDFPFSYYTIEAVNPTVKIFEYKENPANTFVITAYQYKVKYAVTGTALDVELAYINAEGGTVNVYEQTPKIISYQSFSGTLAQISAKIRSSGVVRVRLYYKDVMVQDVSAEGVGQIATATATID